MLSRRENMGYKTNKFKINSDRLPPKKFLKKKKKMTFPILEGISNRQLTP